MGASAVPLYTDIINCQHEARVVEVEKRQRKGVKETPSKGRSLLPLLLAMRKDAGKQKRKGKLGCPLSPSNPPPPNPLPPPPQPTKATRAQRAALLGLSAPPPPVPPNWEGGEGEGGRGREGGGGVPGVPAGKKKTI